MPETLHTEHSVSILAPAATVYDILADVGRWPLCFPPTIHAERAWGTDKHEQIKIWALANGQPRTWTSRRVLDKSARRIAFRSETPQPPVQSMEGTWILAEVAPDETEVRLLHDFSLLTEDPAGREWVDHAVEANSTAELGSLKVAAESPDGLILDFTDTVTIEGTPAAAYDFIYQCAQWPSRLPHVARLAVAEDAPGIQVMEMDTLSGDGPSASVHTTESVRVCLPETRIVYKQTKTPPVMAAHTGEWRFTAVAGGVEASSRHAVVIDPVAAREVFPRASVSQVGSQVRKALGENSRSTLRCAKAHVEHSRAGAAHVGHRR
jgi:aromatase